MAVPEKLVVDLWQVSQDALVGMWLLGLVTSALVTAKLVPPPWQLAHPLVMPVWFIAVPAKLVVDLWQVSQAAVVGMWLLGLAKPAPPAV